MAVTSHTIKTFGSLAEIPAEKWRALCPPGFPFADPEFLGALEVSGAVGERAGWLPLHLTAWEGDRLVGASNLYAKSHSYGEYIFDWAWAEAYARHRMLYYPKFLSMSPFTPATGPKLLIAGGADRNAVADALLHAAREQTAATDASSLHYLFLTPEEIPYFERAGFLIRHSFQYHWKNRGYATFEDFLGQLKTRKRKHILKERSELRAEGITIRRLTGADLTPEMASLFFRFYRSTTEKMGAIPYLPLNFFERVFATMPDRTMLMLASRGEEPVAGALYYEKGDALYGRYWGCLRDVRNLHFELCYYQPIEYAIARGLRIFEAGAQGEHKIPRGFLPELTYSAHWIRHPQFSDAIAQFIAEEKTAIAHLLANIDSPYRQMP